MTTATDPAEDGDELITTAELARELKVPVGRLRKARVFGGDAPPFIKLGRLVRYRRRDVRAWLEAKPSLRSTSEY